jgi:NAD(P)-dependent dehydrogenase (short-subunit alcohol dehydrogenase family)
VANKAVVAKPPGLSKDGWEIQFAVNHLAHAMIVKMVLPALQAAAVKPDSDVRVVMVSSLGFRFASGSGIKFATLNTVQDGLMGPWVRYGQSKLGNVLLAREIARRYPNITAVSVQPGVTQTELVSSTRLRDRVLIAITNWTTYFTTEEGSLNQLWMAVGAKKLDIVNGGFYLPAGVDSTSMLAEITNRDSLAIELWDWTNKVLNKV